MYCGVRVLRVKWLVDSIGMWRWLSLSVSRGLVPSVNLFTHCDRVRAAEGGSACCLMLDFR